MEETIDPDDRTFNAGGTDAADASRL